MYAQVKELGTVVRDALKSVGYGAQDVEIIATETVEGHSSGGKGQRGFVIIANLDTGATKRATGSWGGSNIFNRTLADDCPDIIEIPENGAVIKGVTGYPRTFATVYAHPNATGRMLTTGPPEELTDDDQQALYCFGAIKGGEYRRDEMRRRGVSEETVDSLVDRGYLKRNRAGATQITTAGKNARTIRY